MGVPFTEIWGRVPSVPPVDTPMVVKCVTSGDVVSGVTKCDPFSIWNQPKTCGSVIDATSSES